MKKKIALMVVLALLINLSLVSFSFAGYDNVPWSIKPQPMTVAE